MSSVRVAMVGAGKMAREHAYALAGLDGVEVVGVAALSEDHARDFAREFGARVATDDVERLYELTRADVVVVAASESATADIAPVVFEYPWAVVLEKPPGYSMNQAVHLRDLAKGRPGPTYVALNRRHYGVMKLVKAQLNADGAQRIIQVLDQQDEADGIALGRPADVLARWMFVNSIHLIDLIRFFGRGRIVSVTSDAWGSAPGPRLVTARVIFESGDVAAYQAVWGAPGPWAVAVTTSHGRWEMRPLESGTYQPAGAAAGIPLERFPDDGRFKAGILDQAREIVKAARGEVAELTSLDDALESMRLVERIYFPSATWRLPGE